MTNDPESFLTVMNLQASLAKAARGWAITLGLILAVGFALAYGGGWSGEATLAAFALASTVFVGVPMIVHVLFGLRRISASTGRISILRLGGQELSFAQSQIRKCNEFSIRRLSIELIRIVTECETYWLTLSGFTADQQTKILAMLRPERIGRTNGLFV